MRSREEELFNGHRLLRPLCLRSGPSLCASRDVSAMKSLKLSLVATSVLLAATAVAQEGQSETPAVESAEAPLAETTVPTSGSEAPTAESAADLSTSQTAAPEETLNLAALGISDDAG